MISSRGLRKHKKKKLPVTNPAVLYSKISGIVNSVATEKLVAAGPQGGAVVTPREVVPAWRQSPTAGPVWP